MVVSAITSYIWCKRNVYFNIIPLHVIFSYRIWHLQFWNVWDEDLNLFSGSLSSWRKLFLMFTGLSKLFVVITGTNIILEFPCVFAKKIVPFHDGLTFTSPVQGKYPNRVDHLFSLLSVPDCLLIHCPIGTVPVCWGLLKAKLHSFCCCCWKQASGISFVYFLLHFGNPHNSWQIRKIKLLAPFYTRRDIKR